MDDWPGVRGLTVNRWMNGEGSGWMKIHALRTTMFTFTTDSTIHLFYCR